VASDDHPYLVPVVSVAYAVTLGAALLAIDQLAEYLPGPWFEALGAAVLILSAMTIVVLLRAGLRRHREGLERRALLWAGGAVLPVVLATLAIFSLVESAQNASLLSGADTHLTRPVLYALLRPTSTKLVHERPGLADTETIYQDFTATNLNSIVPFYEARLAKDGWAEDTTSATASIIRFGKGAYILALEISPPSTYTLTVDHVNPNLLQSPSPSPT